MNKKTPPRFDGNLRKIALRVPEEIRECSGIIVFGRRIKSLAFTTDLAIIRNINADAILAVYPFTPQPIINQNLLATAEIPVFAGIGGGLTQGDRVVKLANFAEMQGAAGVVVNTPTDPNVIRRISESIDIPIVITAAQLSERLFEQIDAGASIINAACGKNTPDVVSKLRDRAPGIPIIASGGGKRETILETIHAGANAISWSPPSTKDLFGEIMENYREGRSYQAH